MGIFGIGDDPYDQGNAAFSYAKDYRAGAASPGNITMFSPEDNPSLDERHYGYVGEQRVLMPSLRERYGGDIAMSRDKYSLAKAAEAASPVTSGYDTAAGTAADRFDTLYRGDVGSQENQKRGLESLWSTIQGQTPSVANQQLMRGLQASQAAQASTAASARGGGANLAAAQRLGAQQQASLGAQANEQAAMLRAQEIAQAQGQYGQLSTAMRASGQSEAQMQAQRELALRQMSQQATQTQLQANIARDQTRVDAYNRAAAIRAGISEGSANRNTQAVGSAVSAGAALGAAAVMSDRRLKKEIRSADGEVERTLDALRAYSYRYKDDRYGEGRRPGIMAQDLERSRLGKQAVMQLPQGKAVDVQKGLSLALAASANLNSRLRELEK